MIDQEERQARIGLACAASLRPLPAPPSDAASPLERWEQVCAAFPQIDPARVDADAAQAGWRILVPGDAEWPAIPSGTAGLEQVPWALWVRGDGDLRMATRRSVAVIGTRAPTAYGEQVAGLLAGDLAGRGWTVVTSTALGCDARAFAAAASADTAPVVVYAAGPDLAAFTRREPVPHGLLVSDAPPDSPARRDRFLARQDLLCYLSAGVVLAEAVFHGSTFAAVSPARRRGRLLMAVPGPITSRASAACHYLIRDHTAALVDSGEDICSALLAALTAPSDPPAEGAR
ncbi:DNA protecting protein DprA (fragment) [Frankia canadensis]|uniref:DNA protecting protein DprA n=1 Tax=Frankia canadensis TaxID=1836972 RepID=A0A2I2KVT2_9ACTN